MNTGTLRGKKCSHCGEIFKRGAASMVNTNHCANCHIIGWQEEMYRVGCNVTKPQNLGKLCHVIKVSLQDCPKVVVDGEVYRDVTNLLHEDTKYRKTYPTKEEWEKIRAYNYRRARVEKREKDIERRGWFSDQEKEQIMGLRSEGLTYAQISVRTGANETSIGAVVRRMEGR